MKGNLDSKHFKELCFIFRFACFPELLSCQKKGTDGHPPTLNSH